MNSILHLWMLIGDAVAVFDGLLLVVIGPLALFIVFAIVVMAPISLVLTLMAKLAGKPATRPMRLAEVDDLRIDPKMRREWDPLVTSVWTRRTRK